MSRRVDVVIPCYQYGHFLRDCANSILSQEGVEVRILIIDDASTDNTTQVAAELAANDARVEFRRHSQNQGNIATYNEGILKWANADYTLLISADDMLIPGALARACRLLDTNPEVGMAYGRVIIYRSGEPLPEPAKITKPDPWRICPGYEWIEGLVKNIGRGVVSPEVVVRTDVQHQLGGYRKELPYSADIEMWIRYALRGPIGIIEADQAYLRRHESNMHYQRDYSLLNVLKDRAVAFQAAFMYFGRKDEEQQRLEQLAMRSIAECAMWAGSDGFDKGDIVSCEAYLDFASRIFPPLCSSRSWSRLYWKRLIGPQIWSVIRPWVDVILKKNATAV